MAELHLYVSPQRIDRPLCTEELLKKTNEKTNPNLRIHISGLATSENKWELLTVFAIVARISIMTTVYVHTFFCGDSRMAASYLGIVFNVTKQRVCWPNVTWLFRITRPLMFLSIRWLAW